MIAIEHVLVVVVLGLEHLVADTVGVTEFLDVTYFRATLITIPINSPSTYPPSNCLT